MVASQFTAGGLTALEINTVQEAALAARDKELLTPQQQLELLKKDREKKAKPKKATIFSSSVDSRFFDLLVIASKEAPGKRGCDCLQIGLAEGVPD